MVDKWTIGLRIKGLREIKGITQEGLVEAIGEDNISLSTLKRIEEGIGKLDFSKMSLICDALECDISDIISDNCAVDILKSKEYLGEPGQFYTEMNFQKLFYPRITKDYFYYNHRIQNLLQLLIYLPLFGKEELRDCLLHFEGIGFGYEEYALDLLKRLYSTIPESRAKTFADYNASQCTYDYYEFYNTVSDKKIIKDTIKRDEEIAEYVYDYDGAVEDFLK